MQTWDDEFKILLLQAKSLPEALSYFCKKKGSASRSRPAPLSYSEISRRLKLRSRSHVREIIEGLKPVPKGFVIDFCKALKISEPWIKYLDLLHRSQSSGKDFDVEIEILRQKISKSLQRNEIKKNSESAESFLRYTELPEIFAALGKPEKGATLEEIRQRTGISSKKIQGLIEELVRSDIVEKRGERYLTQSPHLIFSEIGAQDYFKKNILYRLEQAKLKLPTADKNRSLYFSSTFSVNAADVPQLREELRQLLTSYVDNSEASEGSQIVNLITVFG